MIQALVFISIFMMFVFALYIVYEAYYDIHYKKYTCHKCKVVLMIPKDQHHHTDHECNKKTSSTTIFWE